MKRKQPQVYTGRNNAYKKNYKRYRPVLSSRNYLGTLGAPRVGTGPERKFLDLNNNLQLATLAQAAGSGGQSGAVTIGLLNPLIQGTDSTTRIGRKILMKSIQIKLDMALQNAGAGVPDAGRDAGTVRFMVVYDSQTNGAALAATDVLVVTGGSAVVAPMNLNNRERFKIIWDKNRIIDPQGPAQIFFKLYKKCTLPMIFNGGNAGTVADIQTGSIYFLMVTSSQATAVGTMLGQIYSRIRFIDD